MKNITYKLLLDTIFDSKNKKRKVWTPTIVLDRSGVARTPIPYSNWSTKDRLRVKKLLNDIWKNKYIVQKVKPDTRNSYLAGGEIAYVRVEDAKGEYFVPCEGCSEPILCNVNSKSDLYQKCNKCKD